MNTGKFAMIMHLAIVIITKFLLIFARALVYQNSGASICEYF